MKEIEVVTIHQAKTHLSRLVRKVAEGQEIIIARGKEPVARLVPISSGKLHRRIGTARGQVQIAPDFDDPIEDLGNHV